MAKARSSRSLQPYRYQSPDIPMAAIRRYARQIAERFQPDKIILFGSYAYGQPHAESDVDLLVVMPTNDVVNQAVRISSAFDRPFVVDLIVLTPRQVERALEQQNWFLRDVISKGKVLYEAPDKAVGAHRTSSTLPKRQLLNMRRAAFRGGVADCRSKSQRSRRAGCAIG
jgi:predicted nucleotidyltransferase